MSGFRSIIEEEYTVNAVKNIPPFGCLLASPSLCQDSKVLYVHTNSMEEVPSLDEGYNMAQVWGVLAKRFLGTPGGCVIIQGRSSVGHVIKGL